MTLEERIEAFKHLINVTLFDLPMNEHELVWGEGQFFEYWTEYSAGDKKARWEKETSFGIKRRFATWKRNNEKWNKVNTKPTFQEQAIAKQNSLDELFKQIDNKVLGS